MKETIFVPHTYVDEHNNVVETIREAEEFSFFKKIKIFISTIMCFFNNRE